MGLCWPSQAASASFFCLCCRVPKLCLSAGCWLQQQGGRAQQAAAAGHAVRREGAGCAAAVEAGEHAAFQVQDWHAGIEGPDLDMCRRKAEEAAPAEAAPPPAKRSRKGKAAAAVEELSQHLGLACLHLSP